MAIRRVLFDNRPYMHGWEEIVKEKGATARFTFVETGPAMSVIPLEIADQNVFIFLVKEERLPGQFELKAVGGYNKCNESYRKCAQRKLLEEAGIVASPSDIKLIGRMVGFTVIKLPIKFFYVKRWKKIQKAGHNVKIIRLKLENAVMKVMNHKINDESAAMAILRLYILNITASLYESLKPL